MLIIRVRQNTIKRIEEGNSHMNKKNLDAWIDQCDRVNRRQEWGLFRYSYCLFRSGIPETLATYIYNPKSGLQLNWCAIGSRVTPCQTFKKRFLSG